MANLILASKREVKSGAQMWHVYQHENGAKVAESEFYFALPYKALRYAFMLRKRTGGIIPKAVYNKLMAGMSASKAQAEPSAESESAPQAEQASEPSALAISGIPSTALRLTTPGRAKRLNCCVSLIWSKLRRHCGYRQ